MVLYFFYMTYEFKYFLNVLFKLIAQSSFPNACVVNPETLPSAKGYGSPTEAFGDDEEGRLSSWPVFKLGSSVEEFYNSFIKEFPKELNLNKAILNKASGEVSCR